MHSDSLLESWYLSALVQGWECCQSEDQQRESCMALLNNGAQINTIKPSYVKSHSLEVGPITKLISRRVTCIGLGNTYTWPLGYIIVKVQVDGVQGYNEDQIALVVPDLLNFRERIPIILGTPTISCIINVMKEREIDALAMPWVNARWPSLVSMKGCSHNSRQPNHGRAWLRWVWWGGCHKQCRDCGCIFLLHYTCEGGEGLHGGTHKCHDPSTVNQRWLSTARSHHSKCMHQAEERWQECSCGGEE